MKVRRNRILAEDETCWRIAHANRAAVLIDAAAYYGALRASLLKAQRSVFIIGWDIDSRTPLVGPSGEAEDGLPHRLGTFLTALVAERPDLQVHLLLWDYSMVYALDREPLPSINLDWMTPDQISVCLDDVLPVGASHHQKIVVIDDTVAFCGGLDLTTRRWDTNAHKAKDEKRVDPSGAPYRPFHDIQMMLDGAAAYALGELVRTRWRGAACETPVPPKPNGDPWPDGVEADFTDVEIGIARTLPAYDGRPEVREVEALFNRSIEAAEKSIYIESQYLTADSVARSLVRRMTENGDIEAVIVSPNVHHSWLEERSMNIGRRRFMNYLDEAGLLDRVRLVYPAFPDDATGEGVLVHAKFMVVDDRFLRVGSANLNNRSMGMDSECDVAVEASTPAHRKKITEIRNRLLAEHTGIEPQAIARMVEQHGSLLAVVDKLSDGPRSLRPVQLSNVTDNDLTRTVGQLADPERPIATPSFVGNLFGGTDSKELPTRLIKLTVVAVALLGLAAIWRFTPLSEIASPAGLIPWLEKLGEDFWLPAVIPAVFVVGGLIVFPVTVLIAVMGMMFAPLTAFAYALGGSLLSATVTFLIGHLVGRRPLRRLAGPRVNRISRALARQGILSVTALRMLPIAPFTIINLVAGASRIRFVDYLIGTTLGMAPGILVLSLLGHQLGRILSDPTTQELLLFVLGIVGWLALSIGLQYLARKLRADRND